MTLACALLSFNTPAPKPRMVITPTSSRNTCDGLLILSSFFAAFTASRAAERMAEITPERPAKIPARKPAMAFTPAERSVAVVSWVLTAVRTPEATLAPTELML